jgi:KUP system potassium uptake protein
LSISTRESQPARLPASGLTLAALGVVFGDIGTNPLFTVKVCFSDFTGLEPTPENVFGILSLITWVLIIVVTLKYVMVVMRADNDGEGGVLALMSRVVRGRGATERQRRAYLILGLAGAALFYGDCLITPAMSVLSAFEGLDVATPAFESTVVPLSLVVLVALFAAQRFGTAGVGRLFGPIMLLWFVVLLLLGAPQVMARPQILAAISPHYAFDFLVHQRFIAFVAVGAVTLAITGAEALYADMGHFGSRPIRLAWLSIVLPALLVNYYGQGALLLDDASAVGNPFFRLAPEWAIYPLVALATAATVIASQATISGAFSMARQAALLGLSPRVRIEHTSASAFGQIYVPAINWLQLAGVVVLVLAFKTSSNLAAAYGTAVTATMLVTTLLVFALARREWRWSWPMAIAVLGALAVVDLLLVSANMLKFVQGGWVPVLVAVAVFTVMWTWHRARSALAAQELEGALPIGTFLSSISPGRLHRPQFTAVYLTAQPGNTPNCLLHNLKHNQVLHEHTVLLRVKVTDEPHVPPRERATLVHLGKGFHQVVLRYGFMEQPDVPSDLAALADRGVPFDPMRTSYFVGRSNFVPSSRPLLPRWQEQIFLAIARVAASAADFFGLPANRVVELGSRIEI